MTRSMKLAAAAAAAMSAGQPAFAAEKAQRANSGHAYCSMASTTLYKKPDGSFYAMFGTDFSGDAAKAVYPGGTKVLDPGSTLRPFIAVSYKLEVTAEGAPAGLSAVQVTVSAGKLASGYAGDRLGLKLDVGGTSVPIPLDPPSFVPLLMGKLSNPEYAMDGPSVPAAALTRLGQAVQRGPRTIVVTSNGNEVARVAMSDADKAAQMEKIGAARKLIPFLKNDTCP